MIIAHVYFNVITCLSVSQFILILDCFANNMQIGPPKPEPDRKAKISVN